MKGEVHEQNNYLHSFNYILYTCARFKTIKREEKSNIIAGSCMLGSIYIIDIYAVTTEGVNGKILIPITGPFQTEGMEGDNPSSPGFYVCLGLASAEAIGIALITKGIIGKKIKNNKVTLCPVIYKNIYGLKMNLNIL